MCGEHEEGDQSHEGEAGEHHGAATDELREEGVLGEPLVQLRAQPRSQPTDHQVQDQRPVRAKEAEQQIRGYEERQERARPDQANLPEVLVVLILHGGLRGEPGALQTTRSARSHWSIQAELTLSQWAFSGRRSDSYKRAQGPVSVARSPGLGT